MVITSNNHPGKYSQFWAKWEILGNMQFWSCYGKIFCKNSYKLKLKTHISYLFGIYMYHENKVINFMAVHARGHKR